VITNVIMLAAIIYLYSTGNADAKAEADICFLIAGGWALASIAYVAITSVKRSYSLKMVSAMIRPESLNILVDVLKDEDLILGMTVTKVRGFGFVRKDIWKKTRNQLTIKFPLFQRSGLIWW